LSPFTAPGSDVTLQLTMRVISGLRPYVEDVPIPLVQLIQDCVHADPKLRPDFTEIEKRLTRMRDLEEGLQYQQQAAADRAPVYSLTERPRMSLAPLTCQCAAVAAAVLLVTRPCCWMCGAACVVSHVQEGSLTVTTAAAGGEGFDRDLLTQ
jgi:hypothetical protein